MDPDDPLLADNHAFRKLVVRAMARTLLHEIAEHEKTAERLDNECLDGMREGLQAALNALRKTH
jgi:hypothetical protein